MRLGGFPATLWRLGALILMVAGLTGCAQVGAFITTPNMMTTDQELQFGPKVAQQVESSVQLVNDPAILDYVRKVGQRVWQNSPQSAIQARFYVIKDDSINAFAIPGGNIYVHTGLLSSADDEAELAAVLAHECGHVIRRHSAQAVSRQLTIQQGFGWADQLLGGNANDPNAARTIASLLGQVGGTGAMFKFSRDDEQEADAIAVNTLYRADYDPNAMTRFFKKLITKYGDRGAFVTWFSSHPPTRERIANVQTVIQSLPPRKLEAPVTELRRAQGRMKTLHLVK